MCVGRKEKKLGTALKFAFRSWSRREAGPFVGDGIGGGHWGSSDTSGRSGKGTAGGKMLLLEKAGHETVELD